MSGVIPSLPHYAFMAGRGLTPYFTWHQAWSNWGPNTGISTMWQKWIWKQFCIVNHHSSSTLTGGLPPSSRWCF